MMAPMGLIETGAEERNRWTWVDKAMAVLAVVAVVVFAVGVYALRMWEAL